MKEYVENMIDGSMRCGRLQDRGSRHIEEKHDSMINILKLLDAFLLHSRTEGKAGFLIILCMNQ